LRRGIEARFIQPGKPDQNAFIERFNKTYRDEVLEAYVFETVEQVREITETWLHEYNEERPHDSLGRVPPLTFMRRPLVCSSSTSTGIGASTMKTTMIGIDLAKNAFQIHGVDELGHPSVKKKLKRAQVAEFFGGLPPCLVGMEASAGAHFWARKLQAMGHAVRLIAAQFVKPYVKTNKSDAADAEAICEAVRRRGMRFVPIKLVDGQSLLHCIVRVRALSRSALRKPIRSWDFCSSLAL
jgi:hypothetical protein